MAAKKKNDENDCNVDVEELNAKHFVVSEGGKVLIISERYDRALKRYVLDRSTASDFRLLYGNRFIWSTRNTKEGLVTAKVPLGKYWLEHEDRRQYREIVFDPDPNTKEDEDVFNLWRGFQVKPGEGDWGIWRDHLFEIGAAGDEATYEFLLDWFAWLIRYPHRQGETAIVWRGKQGSGKGTIARIMGRVVGQHFIHIHNVKHLVGNFNAHLRDALLVFSDEALWAGDKPAEGILKAMITEPTLLIEQKGRDIFSTPNRTHVMMATNNEWAAPVGVDDRRFCIVDVPDTKIANQAYFDRLYDHLGTDAESRAGIGGLSAFVHFLMNRKVDRAPLPPTSATALASALTQKLHSMSPAWQWWYEKIDSGQMFKDREGWPENVAKVDLHEDYLKYADQVNLSRRASETVLGLAMKELTPYLRTSVLPMVGVDEKRARRWHIPPLPECRTFFGKALKMPGLFDDFTQNADI